MGASGGWVLALGGIVMLGALLRGLAHSLRSVLAQYASLGSFVVVQAIVFVPLLVSADTQAPGAIRTAAAATATGFAALTAVAFTTRCDFHFLGAIVHGGLSVGLITIISAVAFEFTLGNHFSVAMLGMAGAAVLHDASNVRHHLHEDSYVAASLELFASIALMFWYVLQLLIASGA